MARLGDNRLSFLYLPCSLKSRFFGISIHIKLHLLVHYMSALSMPVGKRSQFCHYFTLVLVYELSDFISDLKLFKLKPSTMNNIQLHLEVSSWFLHINGSAQTNTLKTAHNTVRPCDMVFALWNGTANISLRNHPVRKIGHQKKIVLECHR